MDYSDEYDADEWNEGHPFAAALIGCAVILVGGYFGLMYLPPWPLPVIMAVALVVALVLWGIGYAVTIKRATANWKLLSFLLLLVTAAAVGFSATHFHEQRIKADLRTLMEMQVGPNGFPIFPPGAENRGPISKLYVAFIREMVDGQRAVDDAAEKAGLQLLSNAAALHAKPALLSNCGKIAEIKTMSHDMIERRRTLFRNLVKALDETDYPEAFKKGIRDSMATDQTDENLVEMDSIQGRILDAAQGACTVLARRHWAPQGPVFMFSNAADLASFGAFGQRQNQAAAELQRLQSASMMRMRESQRSMRRAMGSDPF
jgi:hypothetical protein